VTSELRKNVGDRVESGIECSSAKMARKENFLNPLRRVCAK
jgi:hypothetical protein